MQHKHTRHKHRPLDELKMPKDSINQHAIRHLIASTTTTTRNRASDCIQRAAGSRGFQNYLDLKLNYFELKFELGFGLVVLVGSVLWPCCCVFIDLCFLFNSLDRSVYNMYGP